MSAIEPYYSLISTSAKHLSESETRLLEADIFCSLCKEIKLYLKEKYYQEIIFLMRLSKKEEEVMLETNFLKTIIDDILATNEYTLTGIAYYTDTPEDVIVEIVTGKNQRPSAIFMQRVIDLHRLVKKDLYKQLAKKITLTYKVCNLDT